MRGSKWPEDGYEAGTQDEDQKIEGHAKFEVVGKKEILWSLDFTNLRDNSWELIRDTERLINDFGWYKGDFLRNWIGEIIEAKTGNREATFAEVFCQKKIKELYFEITQNLNVRRLITSSYTRGHLSKQ